MKQISCLLFLLAMTLTASAQAPAASPDTRFYEMRTYYAAPGKLDALQARFKNHGLRILAKHGFTNIGYFIPLENPDNKVIFILAHTDRAARDKAVEAFRADPEWKAAQAESEKDGKLVLKSEIVFLKSTDFSPAIRPTVSAEPRTFELRVYKAAPGRLPALLSRFREHTMTLFAKHGITNIGYWTPVEADAGAEDTLMYIIAHKNPQAAAESIKNFRADPQWIAVKKATEEKAGGSLTVPNGVTSTLMAPADYSPMK